MTAKEQAQRELDALDESQAAVALAIFKSVRDGTALVDIYGTPWGSIRFADGAAEPTGTPTIEIPPGIPQLP